MPNLKGGRETNLAAAKEPGNDKLLFLLPSVPERDEFREENSPKQFESFYDSSEEEANDQLDNWHYFKDLTEEERDERKRKVKELEKIINEETRQIEAETKIQLEKELYTDSSTTKTAKPSFEHTQQSHLT